MGCAKNLEFCPELTGQSNVAGRSLSVKLCSKQGTYFVLNEKLHFI